MTKIDPKWRMVLSAAVSILALCVMLTPGSLIVRSGPFAQFFDEVNFITGMFQTLFGSGLALGLCVLNLTFSVTGIFVRKFFRNASLILSWLLFVNVLFIFLTAGKQTVLSAMPTVLVFIQLILLDKINPKTP